MVNPTRVGLLGMSGELMMGDLRVPGCREMIYGLHCWKVRTQQTIPLAFLKS